MRHTLSISLYGGLMAVVFNNANVAIFLIPSLQLSFVLMSFITGFVITYLALWFNSFIGPFPGLGLSDLFESRNRNPSNITQPPVSNKKSSKEITNK